MCDKQSDETDCPDRDDERVCSVPTETLQEFVNLLRQLKITGCTFLVVGDVSQAIFTQASERLFGEADGRYRVVAVTDASAESIVARLPNPDETPRPLSETTHVVTHTTPRPVLGTTQASTPAELKGVPETQVLDPELRGLRQTLAGCIDEFETRAAHPDAGDVRVCIDSLDPLLTHYDASVVCRCLIEVSDHIRQANGMGHFILREPYDSAIVGTLSTAVNVVLELRVAPADADCDAEQRLHLAGGNQSTDWIPL